MVTELGRICELNQAINKSSYLIEEDALVIFKYVLLAMQEVHLKGSIFGYLFPENIELCTYGIAKLSYNLFVSEGKKF
jgi:serine/threonine protein kinase